MRIPLGLAALVPAAASGRAGDVAMPTSLPVTSREHDAIGLRPRANAVLYRGYWRDAETGPASL